MRVAWFIHRYAPCRGGAETFARAIIRRWVADGASVDVWTSDAQDLWYFNDPTRRRLDAPPTESIDGAQVHRFAIRHVPFQRYLKKLISFAPHWPTRCKVASYQPWLPGITRVRGDYDVVVGVGYPFTLFSYAALLTARACGAPLVLVPFLHLGTPGDPVHRAYTQSHQRRLLGCADVVSVQTGIEHRAVQSWGIPDDRIFRLGMAVEREEVIGGDGRAWRRAQGIGPDQPVVTHLATLDPNKGTNDLVLAVERLNRDRPGPERIQLALAGVSSPDFESFLTRFGDDRPDWLRLLGRIDDPERADMYDAMDLFAMPSRTDSFGIVFLEAWANGKAVVAADAGGVPDVIDDGRTGLLVPFGQPEQLAKAINDLLVNPTSARAMGEAGRLEVESGLNWEAKYRRWTERINSLRSLRPKSRAGTRIDRIREVGQPAEKGLIPTHAAARQT